MPDRKWLARSLLGAGLIAELGLLAGLTQFGDLAAEGNAVRFVALFLGAGLAYALACLAFQNARVTREAGSFWVAAIALRAAIFQMPPGDDIWRYIWEGRIQLHGFNPYLLTPEATELAGLRDALWLKINHPDWASIYPPGAQIVFAAMASISEAPAFFKGVFTAADLAGVAVLLRLLGNDHRLASWYAWNPLVVASFAGAGHYDSLMILPMIAAVYALSKQRAAAGSGWLGAAISIKVVPVFLLPAFLLGLRKGKAFFVLALLIPAALTFLYGGPLVVRKPLAAFTEVTRFNDLIWWLVEATVWPNPAQQNGRYTAAICVAVALIAFTFRRDWPRAALWSLGASLVLSPVLHPWYVTWILPLACWRRAWPWLVLSLTAAISLLVWEAGLFWGRWELSWPLRLAIAVPPLAAWAFLTARSAFQSRSAPRAESPAPAA